MLGNQIYDPGISVFNENGDADFITVTNTLELPKDYPVTVKIQSCLLLKKVCMFFWLLKKKTTLNELRVRKCCNNISWLTHSKT